MIPLLTDSSCQIRLCDLLVFFLPSTEGLNHFPDLDAFYVARVSHTRMLACVFLNLVFEDHERPLRRWPKCL